MSVFNFSAKTFFAQPVIATTILLASVAAHADFNHQSWDSLLNKHVTDNGNTNYSGFIDDKKIFKRYLTALSENPPQESWTKERSPQRAERGARIGCRLRPVPTSIGFGLDDESESGSAVLARSSSPWQKSFDDEGVSSAPAWLPKASPNPRIRLRFRGPTRHGCHASTAEALSPQPARRGRRDS